MKNLRRMQGVTLLEIMLVLAIAAMVVVMSIRYYQSASANQKVNAAVGSVTGIVAAGESYLAAVGSLAAASATTLGPYLPGKVLPNSPWGGAMTLSAPAANGYTITIPSIPADPCTQMKALVEQNKKLTMACPAGTIKVVE